jgi:hypothetical protein
VHCGLRGDFIYYAGPGDIDLAIAQVADSPCRKLALHESCARVEKPQH